MQDYLKFKISILQPYNSPITQSWSAKFRFGIATFVFFSDYLHVVWFFVDTFFAKWAEGFVNFVMFETLGQIGDFFKVDRLIVIVLKDYFLPLKIIISFTFLIHFLG